MRAVHCAAAALAVSASNLPTMTTHTTHRWRCDSCGEPINAGRDEGVIVARRRDSPKGETRVMVVHKEWVNEHCDPGNGKGFGGSWSLMGIGEPDEQAAVMSVLCDPANDVGDDDGKLRLVAAFRTLAQGEDAGRLL